MNLVNQTSDLRQINLTAVNDASHQLGPDNNCSDQVLYRRSELFLCRLKYPVHEALFRNAVKITDHSFIVRSELHLMSRTSVCHLFQKNSRQVTS